MKISPESVRTQIKSFFSTITEIIKVGDSGMSSVEEEYLQHITLMKHRHDQSKNSHTQELTTMRDNVETLTMKLNHAREQYSAELERRRHIQTKYNKTRKQIKTARNILFSGANISKHDREQLAFLNDTHVANNEQNSINESGSVFSDIDYDRTGNLMEGETSDELLNIESGDKRHSRKRSMKHVEIEHQHYTSVKITNNKVDCKKIRTEANNPSLYAPGVMSSSPSCSSLNTLRRCNSGKSLNKRHNLVNKMIIKMEPCLACGKRIKFGKSAVKCSNCKSTAHAECKGNLPLPCVPVHMEVYPAAKTSYYLDQFISNEPPFIPAFVTHCVKEIEKRGMYEKGIYRISGHKKSVDSLVQKYISGGGTPNLSCYSDINIVASALKKFLRDLNEPLLTYKLWDSFSKAAEYLDCSERETTLMSLVSSLPKPNRDTLAYLILHLQRVSENTSNHMPSNNISRVFGPCMIGFSSKDPTNSEIAIQSEKQNTITERLLSIDCGFWLDYIDNPDTELSSSNSSSKYILGPLDLERYDENYTTPRTKQSRRKNALGTPKYCES